MTTVYYSVGTARYDKLSPESVMVARAVNWLLAQRNAHDTWAGPDTLDEFISTTHCAMALMAVGMSPESEYLAPTMGYLANLDHDKQISFFWRSGVFLNLEKYRDIVRSDAKYVWLYQGRVAVHRDYPVPFFLLKLLRFGNLEGDLGFTVSDVLDRILADWDPEKGWYDRTSITSMAVALIHDLEFPRRQEVLDKSVAYIAGRFQPVTADTGRFYENLIDDAFLVFNLCERDFLSTPEGKPLAAQVEKVVKRLVAACTDGTYWISPPPFGGSVTDRIYPTAVMIRALLSYYVRNVPDFLLQVAAQVVDEQTRRGLEEAAKRHAIIPFWGDFIDEEDDKLCFMLMPFSPPKLTEIYERYVKQPIEAELGLKCIRADDIYRASEVMRDIWEHLNRAAIVIAEMTSKNPNVFYELGMAHVLGKKVILITQSDDDVPFDLRGVRHIRYADTPRGYDDLALRIKSYVQEILRERRTRA